MRKYLYFGILPFLFAMQNCTNNPNTEYYSIDDYATVEKYDSHVHINSLNPAFIEFAKASKFKLLSLNVAAPEYRPIEEQQDVTVAQRNLHEGLLSYASSFHIENIDDPLWQKNTIEYLRQSFKKGATGVKVWKNIGMEYKDSAGDFVMIDDPRLDPIWDFIEANNKTLVGHLGEPKNCWLPLDQMTVANDKEYFESHPEYHMFLHPEFPSYQNQIDARDNMLAKHPGLRFVGAHLGSLEWSLDELAKTLDKYPNMAVDMAERISHIQYQTIQNHQKVHDFFLKYQDRILYSTDIVFDDSAPADYLIEQAGALWKRHWAFFTSDQTMEAPELKESFQSLHLPKEVIDKLYHSNAKKWFPAAIN
ncbi:amidohydrolase family protein [Dyadobacter tibetensis]|uniref:amidohydrolase family protein n=1 Tax=Dyadobacter tibetensis TaxID=1211851 RepID=UPI000470EFFA|nr:amidohydrolase family protein [Dyadobacter tibetensis]